jgi:FAT domain
MVTAQALAELEEVVDYKASAACAAALATALPHGSIEVAAAAREVGARRGLLRARWAARLRWAQDDTDAWRRILAVRSLVLEPRQVRDDGDGGGDGGCALAPSYLLAVRRLGVIEYQDSLFHLQQAACDGRDEPLGHCLASCTRAMKSSVLEGSGVFALHCARCGSLPFPHPQHVPCPCIRATAAATCTCSLCSIHPHGSCRI